MSRISVPETVDSRIFRSCGQHECRNQELGQIGLVEIVTQLQSGIALAADLAFELVGGVAQAGGKERVFGGALDGNAGEAGPLRAVEARIRVGSQHTLVQSRSQQGKRSGLSQPEQIVPGKFDRASRTGIARFIGRHLMTADADGGQSGQGDGARGHVPSAT